MSAKSTATAALPEDGLHRNFVGAIERGETNPTFATLLNVVGGLDLALSAVIELYERHVAEAC